LGLEQKHLDTAPAGLGAEGNLNRPLNAATSVIGVLGEIGAVNF
jgi:hypothetical protein